MVKLFKENKEGVALVAVPNLRIYIPTTYFEGTSPLATVQDDTVTTLGLFFMSQSSKEALSDKEVKFLGKFPAELSIKTRNIEDRLVMIKNDKIPCKVLYLKKDDPLMSTHIKEDIKFVVNFIQKMLHAGKIPGAAGYTNILSYYLDILTFHKLDLKVSNFILEVIVSELSRIKGKKTQRFRNEIGKDNSSLSEVDFEMCNIKDLPHLSSNFSSLTSENMNKGLQVSIERTNTGKDQAYSPVEKIINY